MPSSLFKFVILVILTGSQNVLSQQLASDDIIAGQRLYGQCLACHSPDYHRTGPKHCHLLNRQAGTVSGFDFTTAMKESNIIWTRENLDLFLTSPLKMIPKTSMGYAGIASAKERGQLISYLASLNNQHPLCQ